MSEPDYYQLLGVPPEAPVSEIRRAWRRRVRDVHPDAGGAPAEFHALQEAYSTLTDPQRRLEYDTERTGRRPAWLPQPRSGRHAKGRRVRGWRVDRRAPAPVPESKGDVLPRPWYADIKATRRVRTSPSALRHAVVAGAAVLVWLLAGLLAGIRAVSALDGPGGFMDAVIRTAVVPYLFVGLITAAVWSIRITPGVTWSSRVGPVGCGVAAVGVAWASRLSPGGLTLAVFTAGVGILPLLMRRLRAALRLRAATLAAIREFNAFGPAGAKPRADRHTGAVLRELLAQLPAARLFVRVPVGALRVEYTITCGNRVALISHPQPRTPRDTGWENLPAVVGDIAELLGDVAVRGFVVWSHLPPDHPRTHGDVRHLTAPDATAEIGRWLAAEPYTLHLPTIRRLRDRLAAGPIVDVPADHSGVRDTVGVR
ncbi:J domain-containing protein [Actinorhabdospora filicis]|uniref:J domain-containing protein n=1 Tax=Actinorhabdospora filicis TaxID=1785913 RepID=UPI00255594D7|nr:DnaJ domain-containing protein [Actinorhabdospora filicis]